VQLQEPEKGGDLDSAEIFVTVTEMLIGENAMFDLFGGNDEIEQLQKLLEELFSPENTAPGRDPAFADPQPEIGPGQDLTARTAIPQGPGLGASPVQRPGAEKLDLSRLLKTMQGNLGAPVKPAGPPGMQPSMPGMQPPASLQQGMPGSRDDMLRKLLLDQQSQRQF